MAAEPNDPDDGQGDDAEVAQSFVVGVPDAPETGFSDKKRKAFCKLIRGGVQSRTEAARIVGISPATVALLLRQGRRPESIFTNFEARQFFLELQHAEAVRSSIGDRIIMREAKAGDWRAADAYQKRTERLQDAAQKKRILEAQALAAEAEARASVHKERILAAQAELAERGTAPTADMVIFPPAFLERLSAKNPEKAKLVREAMEDIGVVLAPERAVEAVVKAHDNDAAEENERLAREFGLMIPEIQSEPEGDAP